MDQLLQDVDAFWALFEMAPDAILIFEAEGERRGRIVTANQTAVEQLGYELGQLCAMTVMDLEGPDAHAAVERVIEGARAGREVAVELTHRRQDGSLFPSEIRARLLESGARRLIVAYERDVTERARAEAELDRQRRTLHAILNSMPAGVFVVDAATGKPVLANRRALDLLGRPVMPRVEPEQLAEAYEAYRQDSDTPYPMTEMPLVRGLQGEATTVEDMEVRQPSGQRIPLRVSGGPILDAADHVTGAVAVFDDISERKQIEEERRLTARRLDSLLQLSQRAADLSEAEIIQEAIEEAASLTGSPLGYLHFVNPDQRTIALGTWTRKTREGCAASFDSHYPLDGAGVWADCARLGRPVIHNDFEALPDKKGYPEGHVQLARHASVPVRDAGRIALVIGVGNKAVDYDEMDTRQVALIGQELVRILHRKRAEHELREANIQLQSQLAEIGRLKTQLEQQAILDALTGLYNRRYMEETAERELARAVRQDYTISVLMIDIDRFKDVNDRHGHEAGDQLLRALAGLLREQSRRGDVVCRYGGDEFVVLMPGASSDAARSRAEEWRAAFEALRITRDGLTVSATLSIGIAVLSRGGGRLDEVMKRADAALYRSKSEGRNRVSVSERD